ncbi:hypothetical protein RSWS8N_15234 [Cereibacter sphaeroides WS8N]|nr:hypothetical protein RSWS8N_15234 [Cereibacter sphaeroides WS8N]
MLRETAIRACRSDGTEQPFSDLQAQRSTAGGADAAGGERPDAAAAWQM